MREFPKRGEIYLVCLDPTVGSEINKTRPALIISNDINNHVAQTVTVIPITSSTEKIYPFETPVSSHESGLPEDSKVKCNQIRTVDKNRLVKLLGKVSKEKLNEVEDSLRVHLGM
ncbi:MAG: type II toxin-antitoxin system PemK/MazF family toxin [Candidatus Omnitrophica bacterium]|nr:type II toxin-antitoxin system PemK/MazF family toxin [Candidatus Omnitrophota bacterium]